MSDGHQSKRDLILPFCWEYKVRFYEITGQVLLQNFILVLPLRPAYTSTRLSKPATFIAIAQRAVLTAKFESSEYSDCKERNRNLSYIFPL